MLFRGAVVLFLTICFPGCTTPVKQPEPEKVYRVKVKYEDVKLQPPGEWIGGTEENPVYFTSVGEKIITPLYGIDVVPVTRRSVDPGGKVIYPHMGLQLIGDMKLEHFISLVKEVSSLDYDNKSPKPLMIYADSNFLEKGAAVKSFSGKVIARYEFKLLNWHRIQ